MFIFPFISHVPQRPHFPLNSHTSHVLSYNLENPERCLLSAHLAVHSAPGSFGIMPQFRKKLKTETHLHQSLEEWEQDQQVEWSERKRDRARNVLTKEHLNKNHSLNHCLNKKKNNKVKYVLIITEGVYSVLTDVFKFKELFNIQ